MKSKIIQLLALWNLNLGFAGNLKLHHLFWTVMSYVILLYHYMYYCIKMYRWVIKWSIIKFFRRSEINSSELFKSIVPSIILDSFWLLKCYVFSFFSVYEFLLLLVEYSEWWKIVNCLKAHQYVYKSKTCNKQIKK